VLGAFKIKTRDVQRFGFTGTAVASFVVSCMNKSFLLLFRMTLLGLVTVFLVSCASTPTRNAAATTARFRDVSSVDVAFNFSRWDTIYMIRPDMRENGFYPVYGREDVVRELTRRNLGRNLAVVVMGYVFSDKNQQNLVEEWNSLLSKQGFRRVVILRSNNTMNIDGLLIVSDSGTASLHDEQDNGTTQVAAVPSAP
jgi:hypothetical protein